MSASLFAEFRLLEEEETGSGVQMREGGGGGGVREGGGASEPECMEIFHYTRKEMLEDCWAAGTFMS